METSKTVRYTVPRRCTTRHSTLCLLPFLFLLLSKPAQAAGEDLNLVKVDKPSYAPGQQIVARFQGFPGTAADWITIVQAGTADTDYGPWNYTNRKKAGTLIFDGLPAGQYEVRAYFNWPDGGYTVQARYAFRVGAPAGAKDTGLVRTEKASYAPGQKIVVRFGGLPGSPADWIAIAPAGATDTTYGQWFYTDGKKDGSMTFDGLPAGRYQVRAYFNWPDGDFAVRAHYDFAVLPGTATGVGTAR